jgi:hypothetical protein
LLVAGCWLLVAGCWLLVAGCWLLAVTSTSHQQPVPVSVPRSPLHIEDHASLARGTDQPLTLSRVAKTERAAADAANRHRGAVARTDGRCSARVMFANRAFFVRVEACDLVAHDTRTTTLPNCRALCKRSNAARPSTSGYTLSTTGRSRPARNSFVTESNSVSLPIVDPEIVH